MTHSLGAVVNGDTSPFDHVAPDEEQQERFKRVRKAAQELRNVIHEVVPKPTRYKALDRLQEAVSWANWGISRDRKPQAVPTQDGGAQ